jgi:hypothetical protein
MGEHNSPAFADGRAAKEAMNVGLSQCPPVSISTYDPSKYWPYVIMYNRGWDSIPITIPHSCRRCTA